MQGFVSAFLVLLLLIPMLNVLLRAIEKRQLEFLLVVVLSVLSIMPLVPGYKLEFNYLEWFVVVYLVGGYMRIYPIRGLESQKFCSWLGVGLMLCVCLTVGYFRTLRLVVDCNKVSALLVAVVAFSFFKNLRLKYSVLINTVSSATFGVLLIHANSNAMRIWL